MLKEQQIRERLVNSEGVRTRKDVIPINKFIDSSELANSDAPVYVYDESVKELETFKERILRILFGPVCYPWIDRIELDEEVRKQVYAQAPLKKAPKYVEIGGRKIYGWIEDKIGTAKVGSGGLSADRFLDFDTSEVGGKILEDEELPEHIQKALKKSGESILDMRRRTNTRPPRPPAFTPKRGKERPYNLAFTHNDRHYIPPPHREEPCQKCGWDEGVRPFAALMPGHNCPEGFYGIPVQFLCDGCYEREMGFAVKWMNDRKEKRKEEREKENQSSLQNMTTKR